MLAGDDGCGGGMSGSRVLGWDIPTCRYNSGGEVSCGTCNSPHVGGYT